MGALCPRDLLGQSQLYNGPVSNPFLDPNQTNQTVAQSEIQQRVVVGPSHSCYPIAKNKSSIFDDQQQHMTFLSLFLELDREILKRLTLENLIRGETNSGKRRHQPFRRPKRLRIRPNTKSKSLDLEAPVETTVITVQAAGKTLEMLEAMDPQGMKKRGSRQHERGQSQTTKKLLRSRTHHRRLRLHGTAKD